jgi:uncharacterized protein (DUF433 family)
METTLPAEIVKAPEAVGEFSVIAEHGVSTADTCGGTARSAGSRIRVKDIVIWHLHQGMSPVEIVSKWPQLSLAGIHAALAYYYDRKERIDAEIQANEAWYDANQAETPSLVREKLRRL